MANDLLKLARELSISMKHSAGQWMVPGWDGYKVSELLDKLVAALASQGAEPARPCGYTSLNGPRICRKCGQYHEHPIFAATPPAAAPTPPASEMGMPSDSELTEIAQRHATQGMSDPFLWNRTTHLGMQFAVKFFKDGYRAARTQSAPPAAQQIGGVE